MNYNLKIEGMSCMHCVASVKSALEEINGVHQVQVSLEDACALVECDDNVSKSDLVEAIEDIGFDVV